MGGESILIKNHYPAAFYFEVQGNMLLSLQQLISALEAATAPVDINGAIFTSTPFGFDDDPAAFGFDVGTLAL